MRNAGVKIKSARERDLFRRATPKALLAAFVVCSFLAAGCGDGPAADARGKGKRSAANPAPTKSRIESATPGASPSPERLAVTPQAPIPTPTTVAGDFKARPSEPGSAPATSYSAAEAAYFSGNYAEAARLFAGYTAAHPRSIEGNYMLGLSLWKDGKNIEAESAFRVTLELSPAHVKSLANLARVLLDDGRAPEALVPATQAVDLDPANGDTHRVLARVFHNLGRNQEAISSYEEALVLDDRDAWALNNLGLLFLEGGRFEDAIPPLARATQLAGEVACFHNNLGIALERTGHIRAAGEAYGRALAADAAYGKAAANLARVESLKENPGLAPIDLARLGTEFRVLASPASESQIGGEARNGDEPEVTGKVAASSGVEGEEETAVQVPR